MRGKKVLGAAGKLLLVPSLSRALRIMLLACFAVLCVFAGPEKRKVVVGINRDFPPYEYLDPEGRPAGYDVELLQAVAEAEGFTLEFKADTWNGTLDAFREGRLDMLPGLLHSKARETFADFSTPHLVVHYSIFVRRGERALRGESDLKGRRILVERQSQMQDHLQALGLGADLIPVDSEPEALRRLAAGEGDAAAAPQLQGMVLAKTHHLGIQTVGGPLFTRQLCFATRHGEEELLSHLNTGLAILNQTGQYAEIYKHWFGELQPDPRASLAAIRRVLTLLAIVVLILLFTGIWNWSLRRQVGRATELLRSANREIHERETYLHTVIENLPAAIFGKDPRKGYTFTLWNARSEEIFGLRKTDVMGKSDYDFFPKEQSDFFRAKDIEVITSRRILEIPEERVLSKSHGEILLHTRKVPLFDEAGEPCLLLGIAEDITEQKAMEHALRQAQKLESLGVLAGGIAHDFNNLLTAILGNLELAALHAPEEAPIRAFLKNAKATTLRAAELTRQMLAYSGKGLFVVKPVDLSATAEEMASLLKVSISKQVALRFQFAKGLPLIQADPAQIQQVVMNLVTNASEAIGDTEGEILLATSSVELNNAEVNTLHPGSPIPPGRYVALSVKDTGSGMTDDVLARIFDPFFTTKFSGRGLGLSAMLGILRAHHAGIGIRSIPEAGTEFRIYFPEGSQDTEDDAPLVRPETMVPGSGTILLVEDEPEVRLSAGTMLRQAGFQVFEAVDGMEACEIYRKEHARIQVVLMDLTMPRKDGRAAAEEILAFDPAARIILTSGFPVDVEIRRTVDQRLAGFIQKPYEMAGLLAEVRKILG
ncbi:MAG TPA: transporter substrate-binding domain-containing protein [Geothrix sp.]|nr:transporter substrate-binding domain-containing protein [Geothrix sp.]